MKNNMVKKLLTLALAGAMTLSLAACGSKSDDSSNDAQQGGDESGKTYKVAIIKQLDHASLDEIANAVATELDKIAADNGVTIEYDITSGQNDQTILKQLSDQAIADQVDAIIPIATTAAQISALSAACGSKSDDSSNDAQQGGDESGKTYKVAIIKQLDHASLDEIANAVATELDKIAADNGVTIEYDITSGQNDQTILKQLSDQAIADQVDASIPIATTAAQISALSAEDTKTPVVYAAVSDPEAASLTGIDYVTGTSDALNTSFIMDMMFAQNPDVAKVGLLYSLSEPNSTKPIADAKAYLDAKGIEYVEQTANTNDEVVAAASALIADGVDAVFTPTDNVIMAAELAIYEDLAKAGIPHYTGADSFVRNGAYATCGVNYTDLGAKTADLAYSAITDGMDGMEDYYLMDGGIITVNTDTAAAMSLDYSCFDSMGTVVEVTTTKD